MRWVLVFAAVVVVLVAAATARLFIWSPIDPPTHADAVVALGGDPGQRRAHYALQLAAEGYAPVAVVSLGGNPPAPCPRRPSSKVEVICFRPNPLDTRGEAEYVARLAARSHWKRVMVVPERSQTTRARVIFDRCTPLDLSFVPVSDPLLHLPYDVLYEWGALTKAELLTRSC